MARYELGGEFIEAWREGDTVWTRRGRVGIDDPEPVARFVGRNRPRYLAEEDELHAEEDAEDAARERYVAFQSECLRGGWRRVRVRTARRTSTASHGIRSSTGRCAWSPTTTRSPRCTPTGCSSASIRAAL